MGLSLPRNKKRNLKLSIAYKLFNFLPLSGRKKLAVLLDLAWIFSRLAHEQTFKAGISLAEKARENTFLLSHIASGTTVLDLGCGKGHIARNILEKTNKITAVDYDKKAIDEARANLPQSGITFIHDDVFNYLSQLKGFVFDYVILSHILEHIDDPCSFLKKVSDFGRHCYIEVPDFETSHLNFYRTQVGTDLVYTDADHVYEFDRFDLMQVIEKADLAIINSEFKGGVMRFWCERKN